jgi:type I restriction enzyme S subunit
LWGTSVAGHGKPFANQKNAFAKVDELMALCDQLEARLTTAQDLNQQLTQAILTTQLNGN